jgi:hypothetical protein
LEALKNKLITRGKLFRKICTKAPGAESMCRYKGPTVEMQPPRLTLPSFLSKIKIEWTTRESVASKK